MVKSPQQESVTPQNTPSHKSSIEEKPYKKTHTGLPAATLWDWKKTTNWLKTWYSININAHKNSAGTLIYDCDDDDDDGVCDVSEIY